MNELRTAALAAFSMPDPASKVAAVQALWLAYASGMALDAGLELPAPDQPGRPARPALVPPKQVPQRSAHTAEGLSALMHAIAHIEFNAINLALDAVWRFPGLPEKFYRDWLGVAHEECLHFQMVRTHLHTLGRDYGDFPAHDGLWSLCAATAYDPCARMALVPRTLEARGLDATPQIQAKLRSVGTPAALEAVAVLDVILRDEEGHVALGNYWYHWLCTRDGLDAAHHHETVALRHRSPRPRPPLNLPARRRAGFSEDELQQLCAGA